MASSKAVVAVTIDVRGTGYQGEVFRQLVYRKFGMGEVGDVTKVIVFYSQIYFILYIYSILF